MEISQLFTLALINPLQLYKMAAILAIRSNLEVLGPAGIYAVRTYGSQLLLFLSVLLLAWTVIPLSLTYVIFKRKGVL
jgi:Cu-processing system permease protein